MKAEKDKITMNDGSIWMMKNKSINLKDLYYSAAGAALTGNDDPNNPFFPFFKKAYKNMASLENEKGSTSLRTLEHLVKETAEYFSKGTEADEDFILYKLDKNLFPWQKNVLNSNSKNITMLCGRRSGKSFCEPMIAVAHCIKGSDNVNGIEKQRSVLMMGLTKERAKDIFWSNLITAADITGMKYKPDNAKLQIDFDNGSFIQIVGNNNKVEREKLRGGDWSMIIIDECQSQASLTYLMTDILGPIAKGRSSTLILSGTGSITPKGYWKDITDGDLASSWTHFTATMKDNPSIPSTALEDVLLENGWTKDDVTYRREYLAENIVDISRIVYPVHRHYVEANKDKLTPSMIERIAIGVDYGWNDKNALIPLGKAVDGKIYELEGSIEFNKADVNTIVSEVKKLWDNLLTKYKVDQRNIICVADNSDQSISAEIQRNHVRISNAYKVDRIQQIFDMREAMKRSDLLLHEKSLLHDEMDDYIWKFDEETKSVIYETDDEHAHYDGIEACRYAFYYLSHL